MATIIETTAAQIKSANCICDRCGKKVPWDWTVKEWTGLRVCRDHLDVRSPQEFVRGRRDVQNVPFARSERTPKFRPQPGEAMGLLLALTYGAETTADDL